jgi:hypothetical protein
MAQATTKIENIKSASKVNTAVQSDTRSDLELAYPHDIEQEPPFEMTCDGDTKDLFRRD